MSAGGKRAGILLAVLTVLAAGGPAAADERERFYEAAELMARGQHAAAAEAFEDLARRAPDDPYADDALVEAAALHEERLGDPQRALRLYERLLERYPDSRLARRARHRARTLREGMGARGEHADALARYRDVLARYPERGPLASIERMRALLDEHPDFPRAGEARFWIGNTYRKEGRFSEAMRWFREVRRRDADGELSWRAALAEADVLVALGEYDRARAAYQSLRGHDERVVRHAVVGGLEQVESARTRARRARLAWIAVGLFAIAMVFAVRRATGSWSAAGRALARPPIEFWFLLPAAAIVAMGARTDNALVADAVAIILGGALGVSWLSGAVAEAVRRRRGRLGLARSLAFAVAAAVAIVAICYLAVMRDQLLDLLEHTRRFGHE